MMIARWYAGDEGRQGVLALLTADRAIALGRMITTTGGMDNG